MIDLHHRWNLSYKPSILGFVFSLILLFAAHRFATHHHLTGKALVFAILGIGVLQALVQLVFFLHLGMESKPRWNLISFLFMVMVAIIVIGGSIWIMQNIYYNEMPGQHG